jgi:hypothetical protein
MGWGVSSSWFLWIADASGRLLDKSVLQDYQDRPRFAKDDFITLEPGQSFEAMTWISFEGEGVTQPGNYKLNVWYRKPRIPRFRS